MGSLYFIARSLTGASPSLLPNTTSFSTIANAAPTCMDIQNCRTIASIVWSCASVVFICTWVSLRPNVPNVHWHSIFVYASQAGFMLLAFIAPELVIFFAIRQRASCKRIAEKYNKYGWSTSHGYLALMGGFALYDGDDFQQYLWDRQDFYKEGDVPGNRSSREPSTSSAEPEAQAVDSELSEIKVAVEIERMKRKNAGLRVLNTDQEFNTIAQEIRKDYTCLLEFLIAKGHIIITEKDIQDNLSHADALSKTIAVMQVSWFILQFLARAVERLAITEIEVIALGYAVLNLVTYGLWWNKPLGVRHPVRVTWRQHERQPHHLDCQKERLPERVRKSHQDFQQTVLTAIPPLRHLHDWSDNRLSSRWKRVTDHLHDVVHALPRPAQSFLFAASYLLTPFMLITWAISIVFMVPVLCIGIGGYFSVMFGRHSTLSRYYQAPPEDEHATLRSLFSSRLEDSTPGHYIAAYLLAVVFGAIHCIPWDFPFATAQEQLLWRISSLLVAAVPLAISLAHLLSNKLGPWIKAHDVLHK